MAKHALSDFDIGDIVRLTCSPQAMTVSDAMRSDQGEVVFARWFCTDGALCEHAFAPAELVIVKKGEDA